MIPLSDPPPAATATALVIPGTITGVEQYVVPHAFASPRAPFVFDPHAFTVPSAKRASVCSLNFVALAFAPPVAMAMALVMPETGYGVVRWGGVPSPSWP